jgi:DNA-binding response OmpR family regulator
MAPYVLILEDTLALGELLQITVQMLGCEGQHFLSGDAALDSLRTRRPDLFLLDLEMPAMSGWQFLDALRTTYPHYNDVPVFVATALVDDENHALGRKYGVLHYLEKPYEVKTVRRLVQQTLFPDKA